MRNSLIKPKQLDYKNGSFELESYNIQYKRNHFVRYIAFMIIIKYIDYDCNNFI